MSDKLHDAFRYLGDVLKEACYKAAAILDGAEFDSQGRELVTPREEVQSKPSPSGGNYQRSTAPAQANTGGGGGKGVASDDPIMPFGENRDTGEIYKGKRLSQIFDIPFLESSTKSLTKSIGNPEKARFKESNKALRDAIEDRLAQLRGG